jgi:hypothetical protein
MPQPRTSRTSAKPGPTGTPVEAVTGFVSALQTAVAKTPTSAKTQDGRFVSAPTKQFQSRIEAANKLIREELKRHGQAGLELRLEASQAGAGGDAELRVTHPTEAEIAAEVKPAPAVPTRVEFYTTRPHPDGGIETRLIGVAKHADQDGKRRVRFETERFALRPDENLVIHGELVDGNGFTLAASAVAVIE